MAGSAETLEAVTSFQSTGIFGIAELAYRNHRENDAEQNQDLADALVLSALAHTDWISADALEGVARTRAQADRESAELLETAAQNLREGAMEKVHYGVNPLTTAIKWHEIRQRHGQESPQFKDIDEAFTLDVERYVAETERLLTWEYFPPVRQDRDETQETYTYKGIELQAAVDNGVTPLVSEEQIAIRFAERREEVTSYVVGGLGKLILNAAGVNKPIEPRKQRIAQLTTSQCPEEAIKDHKMVGYAGKVKKLMIRELEFELADGNRWQSQIGLRGDIITPEVVNEANQILGVVDQDDYLGRTETTGLQMLTKQENALFQYVALLDHVATKTSGKNIFMGEVVPETHTKNYAAIPAIAAERQATQAEEVVALKGYILTLAHKKEDGWHANYLIEQFISERMKDKYERNPEGAQVIFGKETADTFRVALSLEQRGQIEEAEVLRQEARVNAPNVGGCGAGSCGLEAVDGGDLEGLRASKLLGTKNNKDLLRDTERSCQDCGAKKLYYDKKRANTACVQCKATMINNKLFHGNSAKKVEKTKSMFTLVA